MKLEKLLYEPRFKEREKLYTVVDLKYLSASALYISFLPSKPLKFGSFGNIFQEYDLGELTGHKSLKGWKLQERFDFSGHNGTLPHINYGWKAPDDLIKERREKGIPNYKDIFKKDLDL